MVGKGGKEARGVGCQVWTGEWREGVEWMLGLGPNLMSDPDHAWKAERSNALLLLSDQSCTASSLEQ